MLFRRFRQFGIEWAIHFWSFFLHPHYPTLPSSTWNSKIFCQFTKKNGFFGNFISGRFRKFATIWAYLNFWQKKCPQGFLPLPLPTPSPLRGANPQNAQPVSWTTCSNEQNEIFSCLKIDDFFFFTSPWWNKSPKSCVLPNIIAWYQSPRNSYAHF